MRVVGVEAVKGLSGSKVVGAAVKFRVRAGGGARARGGM